MKNVRKLRNLLPGVSLVVAILTSAAMAVADEPSLSLELELGPTWQSDNKVQIPNDATGTRFSLEELVGTGPWAAGRVYLTWSFKPRHGLRLLAAPLSYTESGVFDEPVNFAGASYQPGTPVHATYQFNSWRIGYRWQFKEGDRWKLWFGVTAKVRDAKIELVQGETTSRDADVGFVPLLAFTADYRFSDRWHGVFDFEGLAGGPGRAFDVSLKLAYDISDRWSVTAGYRTVEGGADIDDVYNFAWFQYAVLSGVLRF